MKVVKIILFLIVGIIALVLIIALFVNKEYVVKRDVVIAKPNAEVFEYIRFLKNQDHFNKWVMADPGMQKNYTGTDGQKGFVYAWDSTNDQVGKGEQEITGITDGRKIDIEIRFIRPFEGIGLAEMSTTPVSENQTSVSWSMRGESKYPMNITNLFVPGVLGPDLEESLAHLKTALEKQ